MLSLFLVNRSALHVEQNEPENAISDAARALDLATELGYLLVVAEAQANLADAHRLRGDHRAAREHATRAADLAREAGDPHLCCTVLLALARVHAAAGDNAALHATLAEAETMANHSDDPILNARVNRMRGDTADDPDERMRHWRAALDIFERLGIPEADDLRRALQSPPR